MIELTTETIDTASLLRRVASPRAGAAVLFVGSTRQFTNNRETAVLDYECYPRMAETELAKLEAEARRRWPLIECAISHRLGRVEIGEASVAVAVSTPHRRDAFEAGQWLIDELKRVVPIWKRETWTDGETEWVHPASNGIPDAPPEREGVAE